MSEYRIIPRESAVTIKWAVEKKTKLWPFWRRLAWFHSIEYAKTFLEVVKETER